MKTGLTDQLRPTHAVIDLNCLTHNYEQIKKQVGSAKVMPVIKADAYGHGAIEVAKHISSTTDCNYFAVALLEEAIALRNSGIETPILVFGGFSSSQVELFIKNNFTATIPSLQILRIANEEAKRLNKPINAHLKIDTGMGRVGAHHSSAEELILEAANSKNCLIEGIYSHFANSDAVDLTHAIEQLEIFKSVLEVYKRNSLPLPKYQHLSNSGGILNLPESHFNMVRPGILFYGTFPSEFCNTDIDINPSLTLESKVRYIKELPANTPVSYASTWKTDHKVTLITLGIGYADGYHRSMSNKAHVIINNKKYAVVGTICMDQVMINVENDDINIGDKVTLIGSSADRKVRCEDLASWAKTVPHEVFTSISARVPRVYKK